MRASLKDWMVLLGLCALLGQTQAAIPVRIAVGELTEQRSFAQIIGPTVDYLQKTLPQYRFDLQTVSSVSPQQDLAAGSFDFFIADSGTVFALTRQAGIRPMATQEMGATPTPTRSIGAAFVVRTERKDLQTVGQLKGRKIAASQPNAYSGWAIAMGEIVRRGWNWRTFFSEVRFTHYQVPDVVLQVLSGAVDGGILTACQLEELEKDGVVAPGALRVLDPVDQAPLPCAYSTASYPGLVFGSVQGVDEELVRAVTVALVTMPFGQNTRWSLTSDIRGLDELYRSLQLGPYAYLYEQSVGAYVSRYRYEILAVVAVLLFLLVNEVRLNYLVRRRTRQLQGALRARDASEQQARQARERLSAMEKVGVINQMSAMVAHELKQPVASVINYAAGLRLRAKQLRIEDDVLSQGMELVSQEARRVAQIVDRVRGYCKNTVQPLSSVNLGQAAQRAVVAYRKNASAPTQNLAFEAAVDAYVLGNALELELLVFNLVKNAAAAVQSSPRPQVGVSVRPQGGQKWMLTVTDSGRALGVQELERLKSYGQSLKPDGLGIGLTIVRGIVEEHGAELTFVPGQEGGLQVCVLFDAAAMTGPQRREGCDRM